MDIFQFIIPFSEISLDRKSVLRDIGYPDEESAKDIIHIYDIIAGQAEKETEIKAGFIIFEQNVSLNNNCLIFGDHKFLTGQVINNQLNKIEVFALFAATIGIDFDKWSSSLFEKDPAAGFIADIIGSSIVESAADWIESKINNYFSEKGMGCTNRFSPGYCGWPVTDQKIFFSLLPENFCGITLTESCLMIPKKSVSGIIGAGKHAIKKDYQCKICNMENCFKRKQH